MPRITLASQYAVSKFADGVADTRPLRVQCSLIVSAMLTAIGFHEIVERWCGDGGDVPVSKVLEAYVHCRFNNPDPVPVSRFDEWLANSIVPLLVGVPTKKLGDESRLGRVLEAVGPVAQGMWGEIVARAYRRFKFDLTRIINDTTSFYFEGEYKDADLIQYGYSRDKRPDCKQVNVSLNITEMDSIPICYRHLAGNVADSSTAIPNAEALCTLLKTMDGVTRGLVLIADRGLLTRQVIHYYTQSHIGFIGCILGTKDEEAAIAAVPHEDLLASPLSYCPTRLKHRSESKKTEERYYGVRRSVTLSEYCDTKTGEQCPSVTLQGLVVLAEGKRRLDSQKREDHLLRLEARLHEIKSHLNAGRYKNMAYAEAQISNALRKYPAIRTMLSHSLTTSKEAQLSLDWHRKDDVIAKAALLDGKYIVFTTESHLTNDAILTHYKSRDKVEKRVEVMKGAVKVRPIYLHKEERILGLLFGNMIGLLVFGLTEMCARRKRIKITGSEIQKLFDNYAASVLTFDDGSQVVAPPRGDKWQRQLLGALQVPILTVQQVSSDFQYHSSATSECPWPSTEDGEPETSDGS